MKNKTLLHYQLKFENEDDEWKKENERMYLARYNVSFFVFLFVFLFYCSVSVKLNYLNLFSGTHCSLWVYDSFHIWFSRLSWPLWHLGHIWGAYWNTSITDPIVRLFLPRETSQMFHHFEVTTKTTEPRPQVFSVNGSIIWQFYCTIDVIFHISQNSSKFGGQ